MEWLNNIKDTKKQPQIWQRFIKHLKEAYGQSFYNKIEHLGDGIDYFSESYIIKNWLMYT